MYVYDPRDFSVNYASSAGYAGNSGASEGNNWGAVVNYINDRAYWRTQEYIANSTSLGVGSYAIMRKMSGGWGQDGVENGGTVSPCDFTGAGGNVLGWALGGI